MFVGEYLGDKGGSPLHPKDIDVLGLKLGTFRKKNGRCKFQPPLDCKILNFKGGGACFHESIIHDLSTKDVNEKIRILGHV